LLDAGKKLHRVGFDRLWCGIRAIFGESGREDANAPHQIDCNDLGFPPIGARLSVVVPKRPIYDIDPSRRLAMI
jgi:hypothetical protein